MTEIKFFLTKEGIIRVELLKFFLSNAKPEYLCAAIAALLQFIRNGFTVELIDALGGTIGSYSTELDLLAALRARGIMCNN